MQSPECETSVPRPTHHDNSSSEIDAISLISANATLSETSYIDLGAVSNMALPAGNDQSIYENAPSGRPGVVDWVQKHSLHDESSKATTEPHDSRLNETPPHVDRTKQSCIQVSDDHVLNQEVCQPAKKVYDIPTLLRLKETQSAVPVMLRVKPEAIKGKSLTLRFRRSSSDELMHCSRKYLPVYGSCNITPTINAISRPF